MKLSKRKRDKQYINENSHISIQENFQMSNIQKQ